MTDDIVLQLVVPDVASWPVLLLADYMPFLTSRNIFYGVCVCVYVCVLL